MGEICHRAFDEYEKPLISYGGLPFAQTCRKHIDGEGFRASRVYIIASETLSKTTTALQDLCQALDGKVAGVKTGMSPHSLMGECLEVMRNIRRVDADCIVTLGGGSLTDAAKIIAYVRFAIHDMYFAKRVGLMVLAKLGGIPRQWRMM